MFRKETEEHRSRPTELRQSGQEAESQLAPVIMWRSCWRWTSERSMPWSLDPRMPASLHRSSISGRAAVGAKFGTLVGCPSGSRR